MKRAIITGASTGIGYQTAQLFANNGYEVINISRRPTDDPRIKDHCCDLSRLDDVTLLGKTLAPIIQSSDQVCIVHNACKMRSDSVDNCPSAELSTMLNINIVAINELNQHWLPLLPKTSSVIYIGSTLSEKAVANSCSYVVSKHALIGLMKATCQDLMGKGIKTACICPGFTDTEMLRSHLGNDEELLHSIASNNAYDRLLDGKEIADLVYWSHHNPAINGSVLHANLGQREN